MGFRMVKWCLTGTSLQLSDSMATMNDEHSIYTRIAARGSECHLVGWFPVVNKFRAVIMPMILCLGAPAMVRTMETTLRLVVPLSRVQESCCKNVVHPLDLRLTPNHVATVLPPLGAIIVSLDK